MGLDITRVRRDYPELQMMGGIDKHRLALGRVAIDKELEKIPFMCPGPAPPGAAPLRGLCETLRPAPEGRR